MRRFCDLGNGIGNALEKRMRFLAAAG